jgi:hypothetical protein
MFGGDRMEKAMQGLPSRIFSILLISASLVVLTKNLYDTASGSNSWEDCRLFFTVIGNWQAGNAPLYPPADEQHLSPGTAVYRFPPLWAVMIVPLVRSFSLLRAILIWGILSLIVFFGGLLLVLRHLKVPWISLQSGLILILLCFLNPFCESFFGPSHELVIIGLMAIAFVLDERDQSFWTAAVFAFAVTLKIYPLLFGFYFLLNRRYRMLLYSVVWFLGFNLIPVALGAYSETVYYYFRMLPLLSLSTSYTGNAGTEILFMASAWREWFSHGTGPLNYLSFNHTAMNIWRVFVCLSFAAMFTLLHRRKIKPTPLMRYLLFGAWIAGVLVIIPVAWDYYQILLILPASALVLWVFEENFRPFAIAVFAVYLVPMSLMSTLLGERLLHTYEGPRTDRSEILGGAIGEELYRDFKRRVNYRATHEDQTTESRGPDLELAKEMLEKSKGASPLELESAKAKLRRESLTNDQLISLLTLRSVAGCLAFLVVLLAWFPIVLTGHAFLRGRGSNCDRHRSPIQTKIPRLKRQVMGSC